MNDYKTIVSDKKYELMRFWILGSWIAKNLNLKFELINLVLEKREASIESVIEISYFLVILPKVLFKLNYRVQDE